MTNRELLELAAKAAGYAVEWLSTRKGFYFYPGSHAPKRWNPLEDDGDAFRLAVQLRLDIEQGNVHAYALMPVPPFTRGRAEVGGDRAAATRRAIVCAAAEIAKARS